MQASGKTGQYTGMEAKADGLRAEPRKSLARLGPVGEAATRSPARHWPGMWLPQSRRPGKRTSNHEHGWTSHLGLIMSSVGKFPVQTDLNDGGRHLFTQPREPSGWAGFRSI